MSDARFEVTLDEFAAGKIGFAVFYRVTRGYWRRSAEQFYRKWFLPAGVTVEDVEQELLIGFWKGFRSYDAKHSRPIGSWCLWNAFDSANKWLQVQRGNAGRRRTDQVRFPFAMSTEGKDFRISERGRIPGMDTDDDRRYEDARSERMEERIDAYRTITQLQMLATTETGEEAITRYIEAFGSGKTAGATWFADEEQRRVHGLRDVRHATDLVRSAVTNAKSQIHEQEWS